MAYVRPGTVVRRQFDQQAFNPQPAELSSGIVGPLYQVVEQGASEERFDALDAAAQGFAWPGQKAGTVVDLAGTRNGYVDSQRKEFFDFTPRFFLRDPETLTVYDVPDASVQALDQDGFELLQTARGSNSRATLAFWAVKLDLATYFYRPPQSGTTGFTLTRVGDRFTVSAVDHEVVSRNDTLLVASPEPAPSTSVFVDTDGVQTVNVTLGATAGRVVVALGTSDYPTIEAGFGVGDPVVIAAPRSGFAGIAAALTADLDIADGLVMSVSFAEADVVGRLAKVVNSTAGTTTWAEVVAFDPNALTIEFDANVGALNNDVLAITLYDRVLGYAESFNALNTQVTCVVSRTFAATGSAIELYPTSTGSINFWPDFEVLATYRAHRRDLVGTVYSASTLQELLDVIEETSVNHHDRLAYAVRQAQLTQVGERAVYFTVAEVEPDTSTGLPESLDLATGYTQALELMLTEDNVFSLVCFDIDDPNVLAAYVAHIASANTPEVGRERRGYQLERVPLGDVESESGVIQPGRTITGTAASDTEGNGFILDDSVAFVTEAGVVAGTRVVVTRPAALAGTYIASGDTTDDVLVLDGVTWPIEKYGERTTAGLSITTSGGLHTLSGAAAGHWRDVEAGDVVRLHANATVYRGIVVSVSGDASALTFADEAPGDIVLTGAALTGNVWVVRSWGGEGNSPFVEYYIRPLTRSQQASRMVSEKTLSSVHMSLLPRQRPTLVTGVNEAGQNIEEQLDPTFAIAAMSGRRSGYDANQDISLLTLGDAILRIEYGVNYFTSAQQDQLAAAGFTLLVQDNAGQTPYIRDMVTSRVGGLNESQEVVIANSAWQAKTLRRFFRAPSGQPLPNNTEQLRGIRKLQLESILTSWVQSGRLVDYDSVVVQVDPSSKIQNNLSYRGFFPVAEKVIDITITVAT